MRADEKQGNHFTCRLAIPCIGPMQAVDGFERTLPTNQLTAMLEAASCAVG